MKVLFLDIDGVLNSTRTAVAFDGYPHSFSPDDMRKFDPVAIALVRKICAHGVLVVMSSSWRISFAPYDFDNALQLPVVDCTPIMNKQRGHEIQSWLDKHPDVTHYAIVDDDSDMLEEQRGCFVKTETHSGLQLAHYRALCEILEVPS